MSLTTLPTSFPVVLKTTAALRQSWLDHEPFEGLQPLYGRIRRLVNDIEVLRGALQRTAGRTDGDGKLCWCEHDNGRGTRTSLKSGLFEAEHDGVCTDKRTLLYEEPQ